MTSGEVKPVVTLAALYGSGESVIGPRVAERLGVPFLDREIPEAVAQRAGLSTDAVAVVDEAPRSGTERLISRLGRATTVSGGAAGAAEHLDLQERRLRGHDHLGQPVPGKLRRRGSGRGLVPSIAKNWVRWPYPTRKRPPAARERPRGP
jgi:Cytidylate kinase-like family